jgi:peptide/nickel transport system substrate-binding protein
MSAPQSNHDLYTYESLAARQLPDLWIPYPPILFETAKGLKGAVTSFDPISNLYYPNRWVLKHYTLHGSHLTN